MSEKNEGHSLDVNTPVEEEVDVLQGQDILLEWSEDASKETFRRVISPDEVVLGVRIGRTLNIGNYESFRIDFWKAERCSKKDEEQVFKEVTKDCMDRITHYVRLTREKLKQ